MERGPRILESIRLPMLAFSLPYVALWARHAGTGGWALLIAHAALLIFYLTSFDLSLLDEGRDPRFGVLRGRRHWSRTLASRARTIALAILALGVAMLLLVEVRVGLLALVSSVLAGLMSQGFGEGDGKSSAWYSRDRFWLSELLWPVALLIGPALLLGVPRWSDATGGIDAAGRLPLTKAVMGFTILGGLMLGSYIMLCLVRDQRRDEADGLRTSATQWGRGGAIAMCVWWMLSSIWLASVGVNLGWWGWTTPMLVSYAALGAIIAVLSRLDGVAVALWWLGHSAIALLIFAYQFGMPALL
ncbi:MAG: hypothetical protein AAGD00_03585 [Planctomycetota bacterium]